MPSNTSADFVPKRYVFPQARNTFQGRLAKFGFKLFFGCKAAPTAEQVKAFENYHMQSDNLADLAMAEIFEKMPASKGRQLLNDALQKGLAATEAEHGVLPDNFRRLIQQAETVPSWHDSDKLALAYHAIHRCGRFAMYALGDFALLGGYSNSDISKPLAFTGALNGNSSFDRVSETTSFWLDVTEPGGIDVGAKGYQSAVRVRVMHALVRQRLLKHEDWQSEEWGLPINSADAVATNVGFSMVMILGCKMIGMKFSDEEIEAILHLWKYIGYLMGDPADWLPETKQQGVDALYLIALANRVQPDEDSLQLSKSYLESFREAPVPYKWMPKPIYQYALYYFHRAYAAYFIPGNIYRALKLPFAWGSQFLVLAQMPFVVMAESIAKISPRLRLWREKQGRAGQSYIVNSRLQGREVNYQNKQGLAK